MKKILLVIGLYLFGISAGYTADASEGGMLDDVAQVKLELNSAENKPRAITYKNINNSNFDWNKLNAKQLLSLQEWKNGIDEKELFPDWENIIHERNLKELMGRFLQCSGACRIDRADSFHYAQFRSNLYEGDDISTGDEAYGWIFLIDGTMIRLSPNSSITLSEINIGVAENFVRVRVNYGNVLWLSRKDLPFKKVNQPETDQLFFPIAFYDAAPIRDIKRYDPNRIEEYLAPTMTSLNQYGRLNYYIEQHKTFVHGKKTYAMIVLPNITLMGYAPQVEMISILGGKSYIKNRTDEEVGYDGTDPNELEYQLRGFENIEVKKISEGVWWEVEPKGKSMTEDNDPAMKVVGEFLTKRIPTILVARELLMDLYSDICFKENYNKEQLARDFGYRLWGKLQAEENKKDDLYLRLEFLKEYTRRTETTNLLVAERFRKRLIDRGEKLASTEYGNYYFARALDEYFYHSEYSDQRENEEDLNSTTKKIWKMMHGIQ